MPRFEPFVGLRFRRDLPLGEVTAPPYDVLSDADVDELSSRHDRNIVRIDVPREVDGVDRYVAAASTLRQWTADGTLVADDAPSFTLYRMRFTDDAGQARETVGVIGAVEVVDEGAGGVLPHERTTPKASTDRLDLTRATGANLSAVWGLSLTPGLTALLRDRAEPLGTFTDDRGVEHSVERVTEPARVEEIAAAVASRPVLIADGHHRYAISRTYRDETQIAGAELTLAYVGELVDEQLSIDSIHRLYHGMAASELLDRLAVAFEPADRVDDVGEITTRHLVDRGALCFVAPDGGGRLLRPRRDVLAGVRDLDGSYLEHALRDAAVEVSYQHGVAEVLAALADGDADAAVLIRPTSIAEIRRTADEGLLMPPKSTFFTPKLRTGLVIRRIGEA